MGVGGENPIRTPLPLPISLMSSLGEAPGDLQASVTETHNDPVSRKITADSASAEPTGRNRK